MDSRQLLKKVRSLVAAGKMRVLSHAAHRMATRGYTLPEIEQVLRSGFHEAERDEYDIRLQVWSHAIRGSTSDGRDTRVVIAIIEEIAVVTVVGPLR